MIAFARNLGLHVAAALGLGFIVLVHPVTVWFSLFPVSEVALRGPAARAAAISWCTARSETSDCLRGDGRRGRRIAACSCAARPCCSRRSSSSCCWCRRSSTTKRQCGSSGGFRRRARRRSSSAFAYDVQYTHLYFRAQLRHLLPGNLSRLAEERAWRTSRAARRGRRRRARTRATGDPAGRERLRPHVGRPADRRLALRVRCLAMAFGDARSSSPGRPRRHMAALGRGAARAGRDRRVVGRRRGPAGTSMPGAG